MIPGFHWFTKSRHMVSKFIDYSSVPEPFWYHLCLPEGPPKIVHSLFDARQESDYKGMAEVTVADANEAVSDAREFAEDVKRLLS